MSVQEILTAIDQLPESERRIVANAVAQRYPAEGESWETSLSPEARDALETDLNRARDEIDRGELVDWDFEDYDRRARERTAVS